MNQEYLTHEQIIERLKELYEVTSDNALSEAIGVSRQSIWQFKQGQEADIKIKIICKLLDRENGL